MPIADSREQVARTMARVAALDQSGPHLNAVLEWNPEAEVIAAALDHERSVQGPRSPLHGVPVFLKDNIDTADGCHTSAGCLALADRYAVRDSFVATRLRAAGAVLCGKTNMTELANFMTDEMPNGYSSRGGQVQHAWRYGAEVSGSSTGSAVAVAAGYVSIAFGTETCGSIISPASAAGVVGLKPTVGWVSRRGILPISPSLDTVGPMARTVAECALAFSLVAGYDPEDPVTGLCRGHAVPGPECCLVTPGMLQGMRLGVHLLDDTNQPVLLPALHDALDRLSAMGAVLVPVMPPHDEDQDLYTLLYHEFRPAMDAALREGTGGVRSLQGIHDFNVAHAETCLRYGQTCIETALSLERPMLTPDYAAVRAEIRGTMRALEEMFTANRLDAVVSTQTLLAFSLTACPALTLPVGLDDAIGAPVPVPLVLLGLPFTESKLLAIAAALESDIGRTFLPPLGEG